MLQIQIHPSNPFMSMNNKQSSVIQNEAPQDNRKTKLQFDLEPTKNLSKQQNQSKNPSEVKQSRAQKHSFFRIHKDLMKLLRKAKKFGRLMKMAMRLESDIEGYIRLH